MHPEGEKICVTPKLSEFAKPEVTPLIPNLLKETLNVPLKEPPKIFSNISDIIRSENLKSLKDHRLQNELSPYLPAYNFSPKSSNVSTPHPPSKIHVKNLEELKDTSYDNQSDDEEQEDEPMDLSKKKCE